MSATVALLRGAVDAADATAWLAATDAHPAWRRADPADPAFNRHSSSLRATAIDAIDLGAVAKRLLASSVGAIASERLGNDLALDLDQCWIRRQYAPAKAPAGHAPHAWHQDGALGFDFLSAAPVSRDDLLSMLTCWIALTPCGIDAPGIEYVAGDQDGLLPLGALTDAAVRSTHAAPELERPALEPGDALVFGGGVLHHTHVAPTMTRDRTSLELRFFPAGALPSRLAGDRFLALPRLRRPAA